MHMCALHHSAFGCIREKMLLLLFKEKAGASDHEQGAVKRIQGTAVICCRQSCVQRSFPSIRTLNGTEVRSISDGAEKWKLSGGFEVGFSMFVPLLKKSNS